MIFVKGYGQMCNNILQFAHLYVWGKMNGTNTIALRFCYKYRYFNICRKTGYNWFTYIIAKYAAKIRLIKTVSLLEDSDVNERNLNILKTGRFVVAEGWMLREYELLLKFRTEIKNLFLFKKSIEKKIDEFMSPITGSSECINLGVHVRRGDYARWNNGDYFFHDDTYIALISKFQSLFFQEKINVFISTNDQNFDLESYRRSLDPVRIYAFHGNPGEDLCLLSKCDYLIGPPSTFSLMASFYNDIPLYWIKKENNTIEKDSFKYFDYLFRHII
ncbi:MAG: alpha-1,2-fucosyltransferase [Dysgonamonadaceae bacterium]|jgi:hypothetical protein|nr:alpha-1,2-fucosyltransferase [Dysgonamonadaceae bacterium]